MITNDNIYKNEDIKDFMNNKFVGIRLSSELMLDAEKVVKLEGFSSVQEFVRHSLREAIKKHKLQQQILALAGSQPNIKRASKKELEEHPENIRYYMGYMGYETTHEGSIDFIKEKIEEYKNKQNESTKN